MLRDGYSNYRFFQAIKPQDIATGLEGAAIVGETIDIQGYQTVTFIINHDTISSAAGASVAQFIMQHGLVSAAGVSVWSDVDASMMIHSVVGAGGAFSTSAELGIFHSAGAVNASTTSGVFFVGYKGFGRQFVRIKVSASAAAAHGFSAGAICKLGLPDTWPVNEPV